LYWDDSIPLAALLTEDGTIDGQTFLSTWRTLPQELVRKLPMTISDIDAAKAKLQAVNLFVLAHRPVGLLGGAAVAQGRKCTVLCIYGYMSLMTGNAPKRSCCAMVMLS
jgi:hypothetical protein